MFFFSRFNHRTSTEQALGGIVWNARIRKCHQFQYCVNYSLMYSHFWSQTSPSVSMVTPGDILNKSTETLINVCRERVFTPPDCRGGGRGGGLHLLDLRGSAGSTTHGGVRPSVSPGSRGSGGPATRAEYQLSLVKKKTVLILRSANLINFLKSRLSSESIWYVMMDDCCFIFCRKQ